MGILNRVRDALTQPSIDDAHFYAHVAKEIDSGLMRDGLWAKALAESNFDNAKARATYMRMVVAAMKREARDQSKQETLRQNHAMEQAIVTYNEGQYSDALEGLILRVERKKDPLAMVCLAYIGWHGLANGKVYKQAASEFFSAAEASSEVGARLYLGIVLETIDWRRSLDNYEFAASKGSSEASSRARDLRKRLKAQGVLPKGFFGKLLS